MLDDGAKLNDPASMQDRWALYEAWRRDRPVFSTIINEEPTLFAFRYEDVHRVLASPTALVQPSANAFPDHIGDGPAATFYRESLPHLDRPLHARLRKVVTQALNPKTVARMGGWVEDVIERRLDDLVGKDHVDVVAELAAPIPADVGCRMLHVPVEDAPILFSRVGDLNAIVSHQALTPEALTRADDAATFYFDYFDQVISASSSLLADDLVGSLIQAEARGEMTRSELSTTLMGLFLASYHTTKTSIANIIHNLALFPDQRDLLTNDLTLADRAWNEGLRYDSPVHFVHRYATEPMTLSGVDVPAGSRILVGLASANRDGQRFDQPDAFDIIRKDNGHLAFAYGAHFCLGALLTRLEGKLLLGGLLRRFPRYTIAEQPVRAGDLTFPFIDRLVVNLSGQA